METRQETDLEYWKLWKKSNNPQDLEKLLTRLTPLMHREISKWQSAVPVAALESKARMLTAEALNTYNPNMGAAIGTHVASRLRKLSRSVYPYQNVVRLPENKQLLYNSFTIASSKLQDTHGRDPTVEELSDELGWTPKKIKDFQSSYSRRELVESEGAILDTTDTDSTLIDFYYHDLAPMDKLLFEDITGYHGKHSLNNDQLKTKYNLTQGQLSHKKRKFVDSLQALQRKGGI
jgi:DNA-directed RNA polymerase specialized sigma subunit